MANYNSTTTTMHEYSKLMGWICLPYWILEAQVRKLLYLVNARLIDIVYSIGMFKQIHATTQIPHINVANNVFQYLKRSISLGSFFVEGVI
jgi:hypothetical protein